MCGLVGYFGKPHGKAEEVFRALLKVDGIRGEHSTGVALIQKDKVDIVKDVGNPYSLLKSAEYNFKVWPNLNIGYIGHNRWATKGDVTKENAHPFTHEHITMVHNGTVNMLHPFPGKFDTDSETICHSIAVDGIEKTWFNLNGAAALVWWDAKKKKLCFLRNKERPLYFATVEKGTGVFWCSEHDMLEWVLNRYGVSVDKDKLWFPEVNHMMEWHYSHKSNRVSYNMSVLEEFDWKKRPSYTPKKDSSEAPFVFGENSQKKKSVTETSSAGGGEEIKKDNVTSMAAWLAQVGQKVINMQVGVEERSQAKITADSLHITEQKFLGTYSKCKECGESLAFHYDEAHIVSDSKAVCPDCFETAREIGMVL